MGEQGPSDEWDRIVADLRTYRALYEDTWGRVDEVLLARFLAGTCSDQERRAVERARGSFPAVNQLLDVLVDVLGESDVAESQASAVADMIWQAADKARTLVGRLTAWVDETGTVLSKGLSGLMVDLQPAYQAMGPVGELDVVESRIAWRIPLPGQTLQLGLTLWPAEKTEQWNLVCELRDPTGGGSPADARAELRDAHGELEGSFHLADTQKEPIYIGAGEWTLSVFVGQEVWQIPMRVGKTG